MSTPKKTHTKKTPKKILRACAELEMAIDSFSALKGATVDIEQEPLRKMREALAEIKDQIDEFDQ